MNAFRLPLRPHLTRVVRHGTRITRFPLREARALHTEKCPEPTCECAAMPGDLDIDHKAQLQGTVAMHNKLIVVASGRSDWPSKIEDTEGEVIVRDLKEHTSIKGQYHNPYFSSMITACSFGWAKSKKRSVMVFPDGHHVHSILPEHLDDFIQGYVLPSQKALSASLGRRQLPADANPPMQVQWAREAMEAQKNDISKVLVFICGHEQRDSRCGILGPILQEEFQHQFRNCNIVCTGEPEPYMDAGLSASVGLISHIGGHKFAGNVILYLPKTFHVPEMAGRCIWYGRVEPKHVEGIIKETVLKGTVIKELLRGGMEADGRMLNMSDFQAEV